MDKHEKGGGYDLERYDKETYDIDGADLFDTEIKINPSFYMHINLLKAQDALVKDNIKDGFVQYRICAEHLELLCRSAHMLPDNYDESIKTFIKENDLKEGVLADGVKVAQQKYQLCLAEVFSTKALSGGLKIDPKKQ